jgi:drug/metabolite transporter (DMT)-like permease
MTTAILLMVLTGVIWTVVGILFGKAPTEKDRLSSFFALNGIIFTAFVYLARPPTVAPAGEVLRLSGLIVPSAICEVGAFLLLKLAMDRGSQGIAWCIVQSAMVVSFLGSILFLKNPSSRLQWLGMALMLGSLALFGRDKSSGGKTVNDATFFRLVFGAFAILGVAQFLRLIPGYAGFAPETLTWRLPLQSPVGMVFWTSTCLVKGFWRPGAVWRHSVPYGVVVALGQICFYLATDAADKLRLTSIIMPVSIGTCILFFTLWCRLFRGERLSRGGWTAVALNVAGIALLSLKP